MSHRSSLKKARARDKSSSFIVGKGTGKGLALIVHRNLGQNIRDKKARRDYLKKRKEKNVSLVTSITRCLLKSISVGEGHES